MIVNSQNSSAKISAHNNGNSTLNVSLTLLGRNGVDFKSAVIDGNAVEVDTNTVRVRFVLKDKPTPTPRKRGTTAINQVGDRFIFRFGSEKLMMARFALANLTIVNAQATTSGTDAIVVLTLRGELATTIESIVSETMTTPVVERENGVSTLKQALFEKNAAELTNELEKLTVKEFKFLKGVVNGVVIDNT